MIRYILVFRLNNSRVCWRPSHYKSISPCFPLAELAACAAALLARPDYECWCSPLLALFEWRPLTELVLQTSKHEWPRETQAAVVVVVNLSLLLLSRSQQHYWLTGTVCPVFSEPECGHISFIRNISLHSGPSQPSSLFWLSLGELRELCCGHRQPWLVASW